MKNINPICAVWLLIAKPSRFIEQAIWHAIDHEFKSNSQLIAIYPSRELPPDELKSFETDAADRTWKIRSALVSAFWLTTSAVLLGLLAGFAFAVLFGKPSSWIVSILAVAGAAIILFATLALLGWEIQSCKGDTLPEMVNQWLFRFLYWCGTFLFVLSISLSIW
jgi:hypothetical protein